MIPRNFEEWKDCIIKDCKIQPTEEFVKGRLHVYQNPNHPERQKFILLYGEKHLKNIIRWLKKI